MRIHFDHITSDLMFDDLSGGKSPQCVFWDYDLHGWSGRGCRLISTSADGGSECECDHLTNFGLILSDTNEEVPIDDVTTITDDVISVKNKPSPQGFDQYASHMKVESFGTKKLLYSEKRSRGT